MTCNYSVNSMFFGPTLGDLRGKICLKIGNFFQNMTNLPLEFYSWVSITLTVNVMHGILTAFHSCFIVGTTSFCFISEGKIDLKIKNIMLKLALWRSAMASKNSH